MTREAPAAHDRAEKIISLSFVEHLEELRSRLIVCLIVLVVTATAAYHFNDPLLRFLAAPAGRLIFLNPTDAFTARIKIALWAGFLAALPILLWQAWRFVVSALRPQERRTVLWILPFSYILFVMGLVFCLTVAAPMGVRFLLGYQSDVLTPFFSVESYLDFMIFFGLAFGLLFQMPLVFFVLAKLGVVHPELLRIFRRHAIVIILVVAGILTPPDVFSQLAMGLPMIALYEISIWVSYLAVKKPEGAS